MNEDSVEDLTLDDDMDEIDHARPGPSHGGEGSSSQGAGQWNRSSCVCCLDWIQTY
jgi:hypothetical protein